jgi:16S rRNA (adenine1518-N6/adenine1519-N6)-dimethyltransferase
MLRVSLRQIITNTPSSADFYSQEVMTRRPEQLSVAEFVSLTNAVEAELKRLEQIELEENDKE